MVERFALKCLLGDYCYRDLNHSAVFDDKHRIFRWFNDDKVEKKMHLREHMIYMSCTGIFCTSEALPSAEIRKWRGQRNIVSANGAKNKKKFVFIGREEISRSFSKMIVKNHNVFTGTENIPTDGGPSEGLALWPMRLLDRTLLD